VGNGVKGQCPDGTDALSCSIDANDVYVSPVGQIFFMDRNRIRVVDSANKIQTLFGQSMSFGDGGKALSSRLSTIYWIDRVSDGRIIVNDYDEIKIREFTIGGNINLVAGNGVYGTPNTSTSAVTQSIKNNSGGSYPSFAFSTDPTNGDIYYTRSGADISKLNRGTGLWEDIAGNGATNYISADGILGSQISLTGYQAGNMGFNGTQVLRTVYDWNGTAAYNSAIKVYDKTNGTQSHLAGVAGVNLGNLVDCLDGTTMASCMVPGAWSYSKFQWDSGNSRWLFSQMSTNKIRTGTVGGNIGTLVTLPRVMQSFYYLVKATVPYVYYCGSGRVYKYNINTSTETALTWPNPTINCSGYSMVWDPTRTSIIFPVQQNGVGAIAEIIDP
jgi:hypothetical protein